MNDLIDIFEEDVIYMILCLGERMQGEDSRFLLETSEESLSKIRGCLQGVICHWIQKINDIIHGHLASCNIRDANLAHLWGAIACYTHVFDVKDNTSLLMELVDAIDQLLIKKDGKF